MEEKFKTITFIAIMAVGILFWNNHRTITNLRSEVSEYKGELYDYEDALDEANSNIEDANLYIEDAQSYAWSSYDDMGDALDNLTTVDTVDKP